MNVRTLCLAILYCGEATGYEIKKMSVEGSFSHFVDASFGSIYPALAKLEADGCVTVREEPQPGKPARKIYSITDAGRHTFVEGLNEEPAPDVFRSEFLLISMFAHLLPPEKVAAAIDERIEEVSAEVARLQELCTQTEDASVAWTIGYGVSCKKASLDHLIDHRAELIAIAAGGNGRQTHDMTPKDGPIAAE